MKILHIGLTVNRDKNIGLSKAFRDNCEVYEEFPISKNLPHQISFISFVPDIIFCQIHDGKIDNLDTCQSLNPHLDKLRQKGSFVILWIGDIRKNFYNWTLNFSCDLLCFSNERDINTANNRGKKSEFLQIGIDPETFKYWDDQKGNDVVFMGNSYGNQFPLGSFRNQAVNILKRYNSGIYGNYPGALRSLNADPKNPFPMQSAEAKIYSGSKIAISISHFSVPKYTSDRLFRCMGSGCFTLAYHYPKIEEEFNPGEQLVTFTDLNDMQKKIDYYLKNYEEREEIAENGYEHVHRNYTYDSMVKNIIKLWRENK